MTPKEKASDLVCNFYEIQSNEYDYGINWEMAKQCALIAVDEILKANPCEEEATKHDGYVWSDNSNYWQEVKNEIAKL